MKPFYLPLSKITLVTLRWIDGLAVCLWRYLSAKRKESVDGEMHKGKITHTYWLTELFLA